MPEFEALDIDEHKSRGPGMFNFVAEGPRVLMEVSMLALSWPVLEQRAPKGAGLTVMVLPGFMGGDDSTLLLRRFLERLGYHALPWLQGQNLGRVSQFEGAVRRFYRAQHALGQPIALIGQSLGGVFARQIAARFPDRVQTVITLGSPYVNLGSGTANPLVEGLFERLSGSSVEEMEIQAAELLSYKPLSMPTTSIYSKCDGVVSWRSCIEAEDELSENVEVRGSHTGMAMAPDCLHVIADRLAQDPNNWQKFDRSIGYRRYHYPEPAAVHPETTTS